MKNCSIKVCYQIDEHANYQSFKWNLDNMCSARFWKRKRTLQVSVKAHSFSQTRPTRKRSGKKSHKANDRPAIL